MPAPAFDWSAVQWTTTDGHSATGTRLQRADIGPNTYWRLAVHDYDTNTDTPIGTPPHYRHESDASRAFHWIVTREERREALRALAAQIQPGWTVDITDHGYINDSRDGALVERVTDDGALIIKPKKPWSSQGRGFPFMRLTWDGELDADGTTLHLWTITSRSTPGAPRLVKTFRFHPPTTN